MFAAGWLHLSYHWGAPVQDHPVTSYIWEEFFWVTFDVTTWLILLIVVGISARFVRISVRERRVSEGTEDISRGMEENIRDILRETYLFLFPWTR